LGKYAGAVSSVPPTPPAIVTDSGVAISEPGNYVGNVYVQDLKASIDDNNNIAGTFTVKNSDTLPIGNLRYEVQLLETGPQLKTGEIVLDNSIAFDTSVQPELFALESNESQTKSFSYQAPNVPKGSYRLRIQILTSNDRPLGWDTIDISVSKDGVYPLLGIIGVNVHATDPVTNVTRDVWQAGQGVNVDPEQSFSVTIKAKNDSKESISGKLIMDVSKVLTSNGDKKDKKDVKELTIKGNSEETFDVPVQAMSAPGVYVGTIALYNDQGQRISAVAEFRYVVKGKSASVISAKIKNIKESSVEVEFAVVGSADRSTKFEGTVEASIIEEGNVCGKISTKVELSLMPSAGTAFISTIDCQFKSSQLSVKVISDNGDVLDDYKLALTNLPVKGQKTLVSNNINSNTGKSENPKAKTASIVIILAVIFVLIAIIVSVVLYKKKKTNSVTTIIGILLFAAVLVAFNGGVKNAKAGIRWNVNLHNDGLGWFSVTINKPQHQGTYAPGVAVPFESALYWYACGNSNTDLRFSVYTKNGANNFPSSSNPATWPGSGWAAALSEYSRSYHCWRCNENWYSNYYTYTGLLSLAAPSSSIMSRAFYYSYMPPDNWYVGYNLIDMTYVNFPVNPTCNLTTPASTYINTPVNYSCTGCGGSASWWSGTTSLGSGGALSTQFSTVGSKTIKLKNIVATLTGNVTQTVNCPTVTVSQRPAISCSVLDLGGGQKKFTAINAVNPTWTLHSPVPSPTPQALSQSGNQAVFVAPIFQSPAQNTYKYDVTSPQTSGTGSCSVTVDAVAYPDVSCGTPVSIYAGQTHTFNIQGGDPSAILSWSSVANLTFNNANKTSATFTAPNVSRDYTFNVTDNVTDDDCEITVKTKSVLPNFREL